MDGLAVGTMIAAKAVTSLARVYSWGPLDDIFIGEYAIKIERDFTNPNVSMEELLLNFFLARDTNKIFQPAFRAQLNSGSSAPMLDFEKNSTYQWVPKMPVVLLSSKEDTLIPCSITVTAYDYMKSAGGNVTLEYTGLPLNHLQNGMPATACAYRFFGTHGGIN